MARGRGYDQGMARRIAREVGGIAIGARPVGSSGWLVGGWASQKGERWLVILPNGQYDDNPDPETPKCSGCCGKGNRCGLGKHTLGLCVCEDQNCSCRK